jgi:hypothetical protein
VPQAARPNVSRPHNTTLRMCERTTKADLFIDHYPGWTLKTVARAAIHHAHARPEVARLRSE